MIVLLALYALLVGRAALGWSSALNPPSLWYDDLWMALLAKHASLQQLLSIQTPAPPMFLLALRFVSRFVSDPELGVQLVPFAIGLLCIPVFGRLAGQLTGDRWIGLAGAALAASINPLANYSVRVKMFSFDFLAASILIFTALRILKSPSSRGLLRLVLVSVFCLLFSFSSLFIILSLVAGVLLSAFARRRELEPNEVWRFALVTVFFSLLILFVYIHEIRPRPNPDLVGYWHSFFPPRTSLHDYGAFLARRGGTMLRGAFPVRAPWLQWILPVGLVFLFVKGELRYYGVAVMVFVSGVLAANALHIYPLGKPRLDIFSYPVTLSVAVAGIYCVTHRIPRARIANAAIGLIFFAAALAHPGRSGYPARCHPEMIARLQAEARPGDAVIFAPASSFAAAYYGDWADGVYPTRGGMQKFAPRFTRPNVMVTPQVGTDPSAKVSEFLNANKPERVLYYGGSFGVPGIAAERHDEMIREAIAAAGYRPTVLADTNGSIVAEFTALR